MTGVFPPLPFGRFRCGDRALPAADRGACADDRRADRIRSGRSSCDYGDWAVSQPRSPLRSALSHPLPTGTPHNSSRCRTTPSSCSSPRARIKSDTSLSESGQRGGDAGEGRGARCAPCSGAGAHRRAAQAPLVPDRSGAPHPHDGGARRARALDCTACDSARAADARQTPLPYPWAEGTNGSRKLGPAQRTLSRSPKGNRRLSDGGTRDDMGTMTEVDVDHALAHANDAGTGLRG